MDKEEAGEYILNFGKYKGESIADIYYEDPKYLEWLVSNSDNEKIVFIIQTFLEE
jgi:uncharacterized protein (DUF3820 family)